MEKQPAIMKDGGVAEGCEVCVICLETIQIQETALVKGCEHSYCVTCILRWATYNKNPLCPQCKHPFETLSIHRSLDGCIHDFMFEESVCLLVRAPWFAPLEVEAQESLEDVDDFLQYYIEDDVDDDLDEAYSERKYSGIRIGNRRWGNNGYVRAGRNEARPSNRQYVDDPDVGPSRKGKEKVVGEDPKGRRAKRALKREAADKAAADKHQQHLERFGRK